MESMLFWFSDSDSVFPIHHLLPTLSLSLSLSLSFSDWHTVCACPAIFSLYLVVSLSELDNNQNTEYLNATFSNFGANNDQASRPGSPKVLKVLTFPGRNKLIPQPAHFRSQSGTLSCSNQVLNLRGRRELAVAWSFALFLWEGRRRSPQVVYFAVLCQQLQASTAFSMPHNIPWGELLLSGGVLEGEELHFWGNSFRSVLLLIQISRLFLKHVPLISPKALTLTVFPRHRPHVKHASGKHRARARRRLFDPRSFLDA